MHMIETYWYAWIAGAMICVAVAAVRYASKIRSISSNSHDDNFMDGFLVTLVFAGGAWIFTFLTFISIVLNIITFAKA